jgi:hypothetical protein
MRAVCSILLLALVLTPADRAGAESEPEVEITYLLNAVSDSGCIFTRNNEEYSAADAADHLRLKYRRGKRYATTAEQFIDRLATESSWTGTPYTVTCEGATEPSAQWLRRALSGYRGGDTQMAPR